MSNATYRAVEAKFQKPRDDSDDGDQKHRQEGYAMIPQSIIESDLDDGEFRTFCEVVLMGGHPSARWDVPSGAQKLAERIGKKADTVATHLRRLAGCGLIGLDDSGNRQMKFWVIHNPAWVDDPEADNPRQTHVNPDVVLGMAPLRARTTNRARAKRGLPLPEPTEENRAKRNERDRARRAAAATGSPTNGGDVSPTHSPDDRGGRAPTSGGDAPTTGGVVSRSADRPLIIKTGYEGKTIDGTSNPLSVETLETESQVTADFKNLRVDDDTGEIFDEVISDVAVIDASREIQIEWPEDGDVDELVRIVERHPGDTRMRLVFADGKKLRPLQGVSVGGRLYADLRALLGADARIDIILADQMATT